MSQLNRGSLEGALRAYSTILKQDPKDRRIRQKVGELLLKLGRPAEAEKQLREVAEGLVREGAHRAAVAVLKQLLTLRGEEPGLQIELAECYVGSGHPNEARQHFDTAMRLSIGAGRPLDAAKPARRLAELNPLEPAAKLRVAELLEAGGDNIGASTVYQEVAEEYRRRGRPDEVGRVAEIALRLRPEDAGLLLDAAGARVAAADWKRALVHLQVAFAADPRDPRTLDLLARALDGLGQPDKSLRVLTELARVAAERVDPVLEADALRRASRLAPADAELQSWLAQAEQRLARAERRITQLALAQSANEVELRVQVRAEVCARYGFPQRAEAALREGLSASPGSLPLLASLAELLAAGNRRDEAVAVLEAILPRAGSEAEAVEDRLAVLGVADLAALSSGDGAQAAPLEEALEETIRAPAASKPPVAPASESVKRAADPDEDAFADFGPTDGTFAEVQPDALDEVIGVDLEEARSLVAVGMWADALALLEGAATLEGEVLRAQAIRGRGDVVGALDGLRGAVNDAAESDPAYADALFELSALYTATGKHRAAVRLLEELRDLDPSYRSSDVEARLRGLQKLLK